MCLQTLLDEADLPYEAYYGIGAMAGQYCREHVCEKVPEFEGLLSRLAKVVVNPSKGNKQKENTVRASTRIYQVFFPSITLKFIFFFRSLQLLKVLRT